MLSSRQYLNRGWTSKQRDDDSENAWLPVQKVPSQVHIDLLANNKIPDPFIDLNELAVQWVAEKDWVYRVPFKCQTEPTTDKVVTTDIVFEGLDTFATVYLNGIQILQSENMFLSHRVHVTELLKGNESENVLEIVFESALLRGRELVKEHSHEHRFIARQTADSRIPVRKAQYHWGWDWGPILKTAGPWRPIYIEQYVARIDDVWAQNEVSKDLKRCSGSIFAKTSGARPGNDKILVSLSLEGNTLFEKQCDIDSSDLVEISYNLDDPKLWYPHGYGEQNRYTLKAVLIRQGSQSTLDSKSKLIGFRRCKLIQEQDSAGKSFYFRVNDIDIFAGGSCWIPGDSFLSEISKDRYRDWMKLMIEGNQIMIRIWGGGIYENDSFLDACDELGILVWHDFCFACGSYPTYPAFLESVAQEAKLNLRRFRSHPSLVIWTGNNEDYQVQERYRLDYRYEEDKDPESWLKSSFPARYIYEYFLPKLVKQEDPSVIYHPSSPWGDGKHTADPTVGDIHQWNIWHGAMNKYQDSHLLSGRFISEFGMEAYPHLQTIRSMITDKQQQYPGSMTMDFRNKAYDHERRLMTYIAENFQIRYDLPSFTHLTQVMQADTMSFAYKAWRRQWGQPGARLCGGVLVWQLNDCWPTMSWAIVDYYLIKKPAFYAIARALKPVAVGVSRTCHEWTKGHSNPTLDARDTKFDVWIASSRLVSLEAEVKVRFISIRTGRDVLKPIILSKVSVQPNATTNVIGNRIIPPLSPQFEDTSKPFDLSLYDPYVIHATVMVGDEVLATDAAWPQPLKYLDFPDRNVDFRIAPERDHIAISAERPVKGFVFEETKGMKLSDNGFDLIPGEKKQIKVSGTDTESLRWTYIGAPAASLEIPQL
ncbi:hypothetical protein AJ79_05576 [Helicocarpus griseus UAMH5409]|uniref:Beta-mannosidase B n=1 Tax=Helicocarpus griseus UAMH5409 TaxID=1447875 RepID=A0A2B7XLN9_9EURO|nr:hypothetical protein AJ79_05576 [Helicocarpus griseus UAMH5409]